MAGSAIALRCFLCFVVVCFRKDSSGLRRAAERDAPLSHTHAAPLSLRSRTLTHRPSEHEPRPAWLAFAWSQRLLRAPGTAGSHVQVFSAALSFSRACGTLRAPCGARLASG